MCFDNFTWIKAVWKHRGGEIGESGDDVIASKLQPNVGKSDFAVNYTADFQAHLVASTLRIRCTCLQPVRASLLGMGAGSAQTSEV